MKTSNKSSIVTGIVLLALASFFSICLLLHLFDFGVGGPGHNNFFFLLGDILSSVYGFSSILIPVFLLISGLSCFATQWTARKTLRLLTAVIPFFTCVITENICRSIVAVSASFAIIKIIVALITGVMLVVIEYLGIGILADKINNGSFKSSKATFKAKPIKEKSSFKALKDKLSTQAFKKSSEKSENVTPVTEISSEVSAEKDNSVDSEEIDSSVFDDALYNIEENAETESKPEESSPAQNENYETDEQNPSSMITQEEFAALTTPVFDEEFENDEKKVADELEWNNLPPKPDTLPPEYDENYIDENDPDLDFPPKDEVSEEEPKFDDEVSVNNSEEELSNSDFDIEFSEESAENIADVEEPETTAPNSETPAINDNDLCLDLDIDFDDNNEPIESEKTDNADTSNADDENPAVAATSDTADDIYSDAAKVSAAASAAKSVPYTVKYSDSVKENPAFSHGITIHEENESLEDTDKSASIDESLEGETLAKTAKSVFPSKIQLNDNYDFDEPAENSVTPAEVQNDSYLSDDEAFDTSFYDDNMTAEEASESKVNNVFNQIASSEGENQPIFPSGTSKVFSEMEEDIRKKQAAKTTSEAETQVTFSGIQKVEKKVGPDLETPAAGVNNLTADELSDFFNAQQEENTPKTKEIAANPPRVGNRATKKGPYVIPSDLLTAYKDDQYWIIDDATKQASLNLKQTLAEFNIEADIIGIKKGPVVTMFEILPAPGVKLSKIVALQDNIALSLAAQSVRIVAPIPGKQAVGIEVPNKHRSVVGFREIIEMDLPEWNKMAVPVVLGKDILGKAQLIDLAKTPHMLIAGATGSGKSVCVNSLILSILYKRSFRDVKMILVDPKVVELKLYNNIPHLLTPVITEPKKAIQALQWCLCEMERRYALLDSMGVRDISNYNTKIKAQEICTEKLPYIVVIIDEFADLMATSGKELESIVARLTAMSRAVGIHLVLATQRPSVNVITGLIKANIPTRIAFMVASRTDSNIIIDTVGAEKLLGRGDMLYASATDPAPIRIQGTFVNDNEVEDVVSAVKEYGDPDYIDDEMFFEDDEDTARDLFGEPMDDDDPLYDQALEIVVQEGKASASYLQRRLKIGYNRAARLVEEMEERGIVGPANGSKPREVIHIPS